MRVTAYGGASFLHFRAVAKCEEDVMDVMKEDSAWSKTRAEEPAGTHGTANLHAIVQAARHRIEEAKAEGSAPEVSDVLPWRRGMRRLFTSLRQVQKAAKHKPPVALGIAGAAVGLVASVFLPWGKKHRERV